MICIFVVSITTVIVVAILAEQMQQLTALRYTERYERAHYLAGAGVHHAMAELEVMPGPIEAFAVGPVEFPAGSGDFYSAQVVPDGSWAVITARGTSGQASRYVQVTAVQGAAWESQ